MADDAIEYMKRITAINPDQPFFIYYVPGAVHAPHHPTPEWIKKISDMHLFDKGWNELRETIFANQKRLGVIPQDAKLTPWPDDLLKRWDTLSAEEKKLFIRQVDVFAAYWAYTDHEIGRVIQQVEDMGELDNVPTILEATGIQAPKVVDGIRQKPIEGVSMMYTFDKKNANAPSTHKTQWSAPLGPDRLRLVI
jgi:arylsulfatase A-like enzyme